MWVVFLTLMTAAAQASATSPDVSSLYAAPRTSSARDRQCRLSD